MSDLHPTLLVVDDEPEVLHSLHDLFRRDYRVLTFERGEAALKALETIDPPVIMSDQRMPGLSGVEFLRRARKLRPDATRLLFTGYADIHAIVDAVNQGKIYRYITKPWDSEEMVGVVRQAVEQHDLIVERRRLIAELEESNARLREANQMKKSFIEVASHELNTPVTVVTGMAELWLLTQGPRASAQERSWIERILKAGNRLAATVNRMLQLLQADRFDATMELCEVELGPLVQQAAEDLQPFLEARNQTIELQVATDLGRAKIDPEKVSDILTNLLVNAIKFTADGGTIQLSAESAEGDRFRFRIEDTGTGIAPEECQHVFEPFFTGFDTLHHSSGDYQYGKRGMGLGLCLVKSFVELHGGTIQIQTEPERGTVFQIELPRKPPSTQKHSQVIVQASANL